MRPRTRLAALFLGAALLLTPAAMAQSPQAPRTPAQRQEDLDTLYTTLKQVHPDLFAHTPETAFEAKKAHIEGKLDAMTDLDFTFQLQSLAALAQDSHTTTAFTNVTGLRLFPFSVLWFEGEWRLAAVDAAYGDAIGYTITAVEGLSMDQLSQRFARLVSADNPVKLRRQMGQLLYAADILEYLGIMEPGKNLTLTLQDQAGASRTITLSPILQTEVGNYPMTSVSTLRQGRPATAFDKKKYYFSLPLDEQTYYIQYNRCQQDPNLPMADFAAQVAADLEAGSYAQVILDLRNNGGGSDGVIQPLLSALAPAVREGRLRLWGLIGEATYSSAIINAVMITELGGYLAGTPTSGSVDHFGAVRSFPLPNSGLRVNTSTKWIDLASLLETAMPYGVEPLAPHLAVTPTWEDYLSGRDTEVDYLLAHGAEYEAPDLGGRLLTKGYLLTLLYDAAVAAGRDVSAPEHQFWDALPFAYYGPAANWAAQAGIVTGDGEGSLAPAQPVTRAETAVILSRFAAYLGFSPTTQTAPFSDEALIPTWALEAAHQAGALGLMDTKTTAFRPHDTMTRLDGQALVDGLVTP